jgi:TetR/AcrR family transcriptional regulator, tetracycline repressor protein
MLLRRANVVDGALALLDAEGLDGLTMRKLGAALDVRAGALYRHFPSKEALLDALAERLLEGVGDDLPEVPWPERLLILGMRMRAAMLAHRDGARVVAGTYVTGANTLSAAHACIQTLCSAGLSAEQAGWINFALLYYVLGHTIEEQALATLPPGDDWPVRFARAEAKMSPELAQALESVMRADQAERFAYGVKVFIDGIRQQLPGQPAPG